MKKSLLFCISMLMMTLAVAGPVNPRQAGNIALNFMMQKSSAITRGSSCQLVYTQTNGRSADALFYVFNVGEGFVIVSADDAVVPVLGYSPSGHFNPDRIPDNFRAWVQGYADAIEYIKTHELVADAAVQEQWEALEAGRALRGGGTRNAVGPLLTTKWSDGEYYDSLLPEDTSFYSGHVSATSTALAMAQIINYHEYPAHGFGTHQIDYNEGITLQTDFANTTYQYDLMPDSLDYDSPADQVNAVATLIRDCAVATNFNWSLKNASIHAAFTNHFGYKANVIDREEVSFRYSIIGQFEGVSHNWHYTDDEWKNLIKSELDAQRPIFYSGKHIHVNILVSAYFDYEGIFVCDGYDDNDYFHFNFGWGGAYDGYYNINTIDIIPYSSGLGWSDPGVSFPSAQSVVFVVPDSTARDTLLFNTEGNTTFTLRKPVHIIGQNGTNQITLYPQNAGDQLLLEVSKYKRWSAEVYDGVGTDGDLLSIVNSVEDLDTLSLSSTHALTLKFVGNNYAGDGFLLRVEPISCMPAVAKFVCTETNYSTATLTWKVHQPENFPNHQFNYHVEYGPHGFTPGTGMVMVPRESTSALISRLLAETEYDAYLTYTCEGGQTRTLGPVTFKTLPFMDCLNDAVPDNQADEWGFNSIPFGSELHWAQTIYTAAELSAIGLEPGDALSSLSVQYNTSYNGMDVDPVKNVAIFMENTNEENFSDSVGWLPINPMTNVFTYKPVTIGNVEAGEWERFDFDNPFVWDGHSNVVVAFASKGGPGGPAFNGKRLQGSNRTIHYDANDDGTINFDPMYPPSTWTIEDYYLSVPLMKFCRLKSCMNPSHLAYTQLNRHSVQVDWVSGYQETTWNVEYGPANFEQGTGTSLTVNGNPRLILTQLPTGLYDLYLQADCGDQTSSWVKTSFGLGSFDCAQIGEGTITNSIFPMGWYSSNDAKYTYTQQIFTAQELSEQGVTGDIFSIAFQYGGTAQTKSPVTVWLGHTSQQSMESNWIPITQMQQVFNGTVQLENGWASVTFDTPFYWDGTSNLVVAFLNNSGTENGSYVSYMHSTSSYMAAEMTRSSYIDVNNVGSDVTRVYRRNNMRFCGAGETCTLRRDMEASIIEGETYDFYGTFLSEPGTYKHRWWISEECDSLVTLHLAVRKIIFVTPTGSGLRNGTSWANAMELQQAMDTAASFTDRTPYIYVKKGTYTGNQSGTNSFEIKPNVRAYGGFNGNEPADYDLNDRTQANINQTILFGSNSRRVLYQSVDFTENTASVFDGFTIRGGTVNTAGEGGGAYILKYCTLQNCVITANNAAISGTESNITRSGVAVYSNGGTIQNCEIYNNTINLSGTGSYHTVNGVGVYTQNGVVDNCNIHHNTAVYDGTGNNWNVYGGGVYDYQNSRIRNSTITMNSAAQGGGIYTYGYSSSDATYVTNCIISNNTSRSHGGGVYVGRGSYGKQIFTQCLIGNNAAGGSGGGAYNNNNKGKFVACDIVRNSAVTSGGGLYAYYDCSLQNSIVWGNKVGATNNQLASGSSHYFNMEGSAVQGGYSGTITLEPENTGTGIGYPKFTNPTAEAGVDVNNAIGDWTLQSGSICANMGTNKFVGDLDADLAGNARIQQERADIGAYESTYGMAFPLHPQSESNIIYVTTSGAGSQDGSSWANATSNLQYAMDVAMGCEPPAAVWVKQGTYTPGRSLVVQPKVAVYGGFVGNEPYTCDLSQRDFTTHATIIDGDSAYRVLDKSCPFASAQSSTGTTYMTEPGIILMPITGSLDITACSGTIYDNGGPENNYSNNCDGQITLRSFNPNSVITLTGSYNIESWDDYLEIYDYEDGEMRYLASYNSSGSISFTSPSSVIVLKFTSDRSSNYAGFEINFTCSNCNPVIPAQEEALFRTGESLFDGMTFQNGLASSTSDYGGAYLLANTDLLNCTFSDNHGRGVYAKDCHLYNCVFEENSQYGLYCDGSTNVSNSTAQNNGYYGIYFASTGTLLNSTMKQNNSSGLYITNGKVEGCLVTENGSNNYGVYSSGSNVRIINTSITNNNGGGLYTSNGGLYVNVNIANNTKTRTGTSSSQVSAGVYARNNARFVNCNIVKNKIELIPSYSGGSVNYNNAFAGVYNYTNNNEYTNCIIWGNKTDTVVSNIEGEGTFSYCAVEGGVDGIANITLDAANNGSSSGTSYVKFANPTTTAGVTTQNNVDYNLSSGSVCINAGNPNTTSLNLPTYDLGGSLRIKQQHIDIGAYEFGDVNIQQIIDEICLGESFFYDTYFVYPEEPGLFLDTFIYNSGGMDYIAYINLQVNPVYNINIDTAICEGESYFFNGQSYNTCCTQTAYLQTAAGCDSTVVLNLTVNPIVYDEFSYIACDSFVWNQVTYNESGNYTQTLRSSTGCDSIVTLHLTVNHSVATEDSMQLCRSSLPFYYKGVIIGEETPEHSVISVPLVTTNGCDSVVSMHLTIVDVLTHEFSETACDSYTWAGTTYTTSGDKVKTFTSSLGCDSVVTLHLTMYHSAATNQYLTICDNDFPYHYVNGQIDTIFEANTTDFSTLNFTFSTTHGCDSMVTLYLTVNHVATSSISVVECDSYTWNNSTYTESGTYQQTFAAANGCDSIVTLNLTINHSVTEPVEVIICEAELPYHYINGQIDTTFEVGTPHLSTINYTLSTIHGCDSNVVLHVTVIPAFTPVISVSGALTPCESSSATLGVTGNYSAYEWSNGITASTVTITEPGYYWVSVTDANGCAGISEMTHVGVSDLITETPSICMVGVENGHNLVVWEELSDPDVESYRIYRENNQANVFEPLVTIPAGSPNAYEDVTADPTVRAYRYKITAVDSCGGETPMSPMHKSVHLTINRGIGNSWNLIWSDYEGFEFSSYNLYRGTANNNLELIQTMPSNLNSYTDNLTSMDDALFYQIEVVLPDDHHCVRHTRDITYSGARSNIVYNSVPVTVVLTESACDSYEWLGQTLTQSGTYTGTYTSELGYECNATLHLTITHPEPMSFVRESCESYTPTWADGYSTTYTQSGTYTHGYENADGCWQVDTLHLTIRHAPQVSLSVRDWPSMVPISSEITSGQEIAIFNMMHQDGYTYVWSNGDVGEYSGILVSPTTATTYYVTVSNPPCTSTAESSITITITGIEDYEQSGVTLYPNPTSSVVNVEFEMGNEQWRNAEIQIFDMYGKLLRTEPMNDSTTQVDMSLFADGVYTLRIKTQDGVVTRKIVKQAQ